MCCRSRNNNLPHYSCFFFLFPKSPDTNVEIPKKPKPMASKSNTIPIASTGQYIGCPWFLKACIITTGAIKQNPIPQNIFLNPFCTFSLFICSVMINCFSNTYVFGK